MPSLSQCKILWEGVLEHGLSILVLTIRVAMTMHTRLIKPQPNRYHRKNVPVTGDVGGGTVTVTVGGTVTGRDQWSGSRSSSSLAYTKLRVIRAPTHVSFQFGAALR
jgi:hypothetical protein